MKRTLIALLAPLFMTAAPALADTVVDSNITVALKFYIDDKEEVVTDTSESLTYSTVSIKNSDILYTWGEANDISLSKKARLMRRDFVDSDGDVNDEAYEIFIRDGEEEYILPGGLDVILNELVDKYKYNTVKGTGTYSAVSYVNISMRVEWEEFNDDTIDAAGLEKFTSRTVAFKDQLTTLDSFSTTVAGKAYFYTGNRDRWYYGVVQGTIKQSGAKAREVESVIF